MAFQTECAGDGAVHGQCIPCTSCSDGFIVHGGRVCINCGAAVEATSVVDVASWDELLALLEETRR